jgi:choline dehydrogenase-like flavoprotein
MAEDHDAVVVGSGFGGTFAAYALVRAGLRVLLLERGGWVPRGPDCWGERGSLELSPFFSKEPPYRVIAGGNGAFTGAPSCVGGPSVFYGGVALRFRQADFSPDPEIAGGSGARWPFDYAELEPYYSRVERILDVAGEAGADPTEPPRSMAYPQAPAELAPTSARIRRAAIDLGLRPFRLPLAIEHAGGGRQRACVACATCDTFACAIEAKNDLATCVIPDLIEAGMDLRTDALVSRVLVERGRAAGVVCQDRITQREEVHRAPIVILAAGALGTPHLLLASELDRSCPAGHAVGRYLLRHCSAIVLGLFPWRPGGRFHKQIAVHDYYFGHPSVRAPRGKLGSLQQISTPPAALARANAPRIARPLVPPVVQHLTGLLAIAEDQPRYENRVAIDPARRDRAGLPELSITYRHTPRDEAARRALIGIAKRILRRAGALAFYVHPIQTFSHALGTVRMGDDPYASPLDRACRLRGVTGVYVVDGSALPSSGGVNPSLTIAANALRAGELVASGEGARER